MILEPAQAVFIHYLLVQSFRVGDLLELVKLNCSVFLSTLTSLDVDEKSLHFARQNVIANNMQNRIKIFGSQKSDPLLPLDAMGLGEYISLHSLQTWS